MFIVHRRFFQNEKAFTPAGKHEKVADGNKHETLATSEYPKVCASNDLYKILQISAPKVGNFTIHDAPVVGLIDSILEYYLYISVKVRKAWIAGYGSQPQNLICFDWERFTGILDQQSLNSPPLAGFVKPDPTSAEPGFLLLWPASGDLFYWERTSLMNVEVSAPEFPGFLHYRIQLKRYESCKNLVSAEPAGFFLTLSSGRLLHLNLKDSDGNSSIQVRILFPGLHIPNCLLSLYNSIFAFTSGRVIPIRCGSIKGPGERLVYSMHSGSTLRIWEIFGTGDHHLLRGFDIYDIILDSIQESFSYVNRFLILDFSVSTSDPYTLACLVSWRDNASLFNYAAIIISFNHQMIPHVSQFCHVRSYLSAILPSVCRIFLPSPGTVVFCVFDVTFAMFHKVRGKEGTFYVEENLVVNNLTSKSRVLDFGMEDAIYEKSTHTLLKTPALILLTEGHGIIRIESSASYLKTSFSATTYLRSRLSQFASQSPLFRVSC